MNKQDILRRKCKEREELALKTQELERSIQNGSVIEKGPARESLVRHHAALAALMAEIERLKGA